MGRLATLPRGRGQRPRSSFFTQRVINVWNNFPMSVEFGAYTQSIGRDNLNQFLSVYKFSLAC